MRFFSTRGTKADRCTIPELRVAPRCVRRWLAGAGFVVAARARAPSDVDRRPSLPGCGFKLRFGGLSVAFALPSSFGCRLVRQNPAECRTTWREAVR